MVESDIHNDQTSPVEEDHESKSNRGGRCPRVARVEVEIRRGYSVVGVQYSVGKGSRGESKGSRGEGKNALCSNVLPPVG